MAGELAREGARGDDDQARGLTRRVAGIQRRRRWVALTTLGAMLASSAFVLLAPPRFTGVAKVLLGNQESSLAKPDTALGFDPAATIDDAAVQSQAEAVATADLARKALDKLGLAKNPEFGGNGKANQRAVDTFRSRLTVSAAPRSRVLRIEFVSRDPEFAARAADTVAEVYLQSQTEAKAEAARAAEARLAQKIEELRAKVADADARVAAFRTELGLLAGANGQTVSAEQLSDLDAQLAAARAAEAAATAKAELMRKLEREGRLEDAPASIADESMRRFVEQRVALKAEIAEASRTLLPLHPRMKELAAQLAGLDAQIRDAAAKKVRVFENDARLAVDQVASLGATLAQQSKSVAAGAADDVRRRVLDMEAKAARDELESTLQKYREAEARDADTAAADARVIAAAEPPRAPTFPKAWQTVLLATLAGFFVSTGVAAAAALASGESQRDRARAAPAFVPARSAPRVEEPAPPTALASAEPNPPEREAPKGVEGRPSLDGPKGVEGRPSVSEPRGVEGRPSVDGLSAAGALESPEALAERLTRSKAKGDLVVLIAGRRSGRALEIALETARRLAAGGATLLVDLGATQDWFADILDREERDEVEVPGLADLIGGRADFGEVIRRDLSSSLDVISSGGALSGDALDDVFAALASTYARIVLHASDWRSAPGRAAADIADAVVVVAPAARLRRAVDEAQESLGDAGPEILGFGTRQPRPALEEVG